MATSINAPLTSDIWHLSIDDLLNPMAETQRLGGPGPFVINLSASSAPLSLPTRNLSTAEGVHAYQVQRLEDRRPRYRLRLGLFTTEDEAEAVLAIVRDVYPGALTATADSDDLRALAAFKPKPAPAVVAPPRGPPFVLAPPSPPAGASIPVLSDSIEPVRRMGAPIEGAAQASIGAAPPTVVAPPPPVIAAPKVVSPPPPAARTVIAGALASPQQPRPMAPHQARAARPAVAAAAAISPNIDSTQTLRVLTTRELQDPAARWYAIQLSLAKEPFDPDALPNLDIFDEYRLYSVADLDQGRILHALRLGFFAEQGAAAAVASYLGAFYDKPAVKRISVAERERFRDQRVEARKDIGATGRHAVIEITGEMHVRAKRAYIASVAPLAPAADPGQSNVPVHKSK